MPTLLEKALEIKVPRKIRQRYSEQDFDLIRGWVDNKISASQGAKALGFPNANRFLTYALYGVREMNHRGMITITLKDEKNES